MQSKYKISYYCNISYVYLHVMKTRTLNWIFAAITTLRQFQMVSSEWNET